jgi:hypothetical protein
MAAAPRWAWFVVRALVVLCVPIVGLLLLAMVAGRVPDPLSDDLRFRFEAVLGFAFLAAAFYLLQRAFRWPPRHVWVPLAYAGLVMLAPSGARDAYRLVFPEEPTRLADGAAAAVDVLLVQPPSGAVATAVGLTELPETEDEPGRDVRFSIAAPSSEDLRDLRLRLVGGTRRAALQALTDARFLQNEREALLGSLLTWTGWREDASRAIVLNVDGLDPLKPKEKSTGSLPEDWTDVFGNPGLTEPVYAILGRASDERLRRWREWARRTGGDAVRFRDAGASVLVDAAVRVATERREAVAKELAWRFRPRLFFDSGETLTNPLDVERFLASKNVEVCSKWLRWWTRCKGFDPDKRDGYLSFDHEKVASDTAPGAIYYHAVWRGPDELYLDYWWYFPYNPTPVGFKAACRTGFNADGVTCFDHASDWEGITVVLRREGKSFAPSHVIYAQHEFGVAYDWSQLQREWTTAETIDGDRPVVFVARDSHASYPASCKVGCRQIHRPRVRGEGASDGNRDWRRNSDADCKKSCLKRFPQTRDGRPDGWNDRPLRWGQRSCIFGTALCNRGLAPKAPRYQARFWAPWKPLTGIPVRRFREFEHVRYAKYDA